MNISKNIILPDIKTPKAVVGLGNPGDAYKYTRHNIGFRVVDQLAEKYNGVWRSKDSAEIASIVINTVPLLLIKPQTFMNSSGKIAPLLAKQGIDADLILVIHDELEQPFGKISMRLGGSAKGHNGLKSLISMLGENFTRLRFGIGRPERKEDVPNYVLQKFKEPDSEVEQLIDKAVQLIEQLY